MSLVEIKQTARQFFDDVESQVGIFRKNWKEGVFVDATDTCIFKGLRGGVIRLRGRNCRSCELILEYRFMQRVGVNPISRAQLRIKAALVMTENHPSACELRLGRTGIL